MGIKRKLHAFFKTIYLRDYQNKLFLIEEYKILWKLLDSSISDENFIESIKKMKKNEVYKLLQLDNDSEFLKAIIRKILDPCIFERVFNTSEIDYSQEEKIFLAQRHDIHISLSILERDLEDFQEVQGFKENQRYSENYFKNYFEELDKLKKIFTAEFIYIENINWFFKSKLFKIISDNPKFFNATPLVLYKFLLENTEIKTRRDFIEHNKLLKKSTNENSTDYDKFYSVLSAANQQLAEDLRKPPIFLIRTIYNGSLFEKISKLKKISPTAKEALFNNLKKYEDIPHLYKI